MLRNNTYKQNLQKVNNNISNNTQEFISVIINIIQQKYTNNGDAIHATRTKMWFYTEAKASAENCGLNDKDINSWIIDQAVNVDKSTNNADHKVTKSIVNFICFGNSLPSRPIQITNASNPSEDDKMKILRYHESIKRNVNISDLIHEDCYTELTEILGQNPDNMFHNIVLFPGQ